MRRLLSYYHPKLPIYAVYMFQQVEYNPHKFLQWLLKVPDVTRVMHRQKVVWTKKAKLLVGIFGLVEVFYYVTVIFYATVHIFINAVISLLLTPWLVMLIAYLVILFGWLYYEEPRRRTALSRATKAFEQHPGIKIAVMGSYGKTTMKELLATVLAEGRKVAASPGNKNVPISHARWIKRLDGDEQVLIIEYGEGAPGDIKKLAKLTHPDWAVITGLAPNHLDEYKHLSEVAKDLLSIDHFVDKKRILLNQVSFSNYDTGGMIGYGEQGLRGWKVSNTKVDYAGTSFLLQKGGKKINVHSGLIGYHLVGPLAAAAIIAHELGLTTQQIEAGLARTLPYEHRMQPRKQHGAWIIDDTYNGSLEGIRAGLSLLAELPAKRKIYVTPGLVDQGEETERVHVEIGQLIAQAAPDRVVLMQNSATQFMIKGLEDSDYQGDLHIEADPLRFYTNLEHILAAGDLIMLQNDWTDNYT